jgi:hypothetical protein
MYTTAQLAAYYGMPPQNIEAFMQAMALQSIHTVQSVEMSESGVQSRVRLEASKKAIYLWRNNKGAGKVQLKGGTSRFMRWGLANDSEALSDAIKSADLIGLRKTLVTQAMVGTHVGIFVSREIKHANWKPSGSLEEAAQLQWAALVNAQGGDAKIVTGPGSFD